MASTNFENETGFSVYSRATDLLNGASVNFAGAGKDGLAIQTIQVNYPEWGDDTYSGFDRFFVGGYTLPGSAQGGVADVYLNPWLNFIPNVAASTILHEAKHHDEFVDIQVDEVMSSFFSSINDGTPQGQADADIIRSALEDLMVRETVNGIDSVSSELNFWFDQNTSPTFIANSPHYLGRTSKLRSTADGTVSEYQISDAGRALFESYFESGSYEKPEFYYGGRKYAWSTDENGNQVPVDIGAAPDLPDHLQRAPVSTEPTPSALAAISEFGSAVIEGIKDAGRAIGNAIKAGADAIGNAIAAVGQAISDGLNAVVSFFTGNDDDDEGSSSDEDNGKPIILDLDGDGVEINVKGDVSFDMDDDGWLERTAWADADDGFLVMDLGQQGIIDQTDELILSNHVDWEGATDLQALATYDQWASRGGNNDGKLSAADDVWSSLKVWQDKNQNGVSDAGELFTLDDLGITEIGLTYDDGTDFFDIENDVEVFGSKLLGSATFKHDGSELDFGELQNGQYVVEGGVGDVSLRYRDNGWKKIDQAAYGHDIITQSGDTFKYRDLSISGSSADAIISGNTYNGVYGDSRDNIIHASGSSNDLILSGGGGSDNITGGAGNDVLDVGEGNGAAWQRAYGGAGDDTYVYNQSSGYLWIHGEASSGGGAADTLVFNDLTLDDLQITHSASNDELYFSWTLDGASGQVKLAQSGANIENIVFADGSNFSEVVLNAWSDPEHAIAASAINNHDGHVTAGDFNGDGREDVIFTWADDGFNRIFFGNSDGSFTVAQNAITTTEINDHTGHVTAGDFNGDGRDDLMFTWSDTGLNRVYHGNSDGSFQSSGSAIATSHINDLEGHVTAGDFDGDGYDNVLFNWDDPGQNRIFEGEGDPNFAMNQNSISTTAINDFSGEVTAGDFNGDGRDDLMFSWSSTGQNRVFFGGADGSFSMSHNPIAKTVINDHTGETIAGDFNGDGRDDLMFNWSSTGQNRIFFGQADGSFEMGQDLINRDAIAGHAGHITSGDFNGDGRDDAMFTWSATGQNLFFYGDLEGGFANPDGQFARDHYIGGEGNDYIRSGSETAVLVGGAGNDTLEFGGYSTLTSHMRGQTGDDRYLISKDDGQIAIIRSSEGANQGTDRIEFSDLRISDMTFDIQVGASSAFGDRLDIQWSKDSHSGTLSVADTGEHIENFIFEDGLAVSHFILGTTDVRDVITGTDTADLIELRGNPSSSSWQKAFGSAGDDVYVFSAGDGRNVIRDETNSDNDTIVFKDLDRDDVTFERHSNGSDGSIIITADGLSLHIHGASSNHTGIENYLFADGTLLTDEDFLF